MEKFKYLGITVTNTNDIHEEIKRRINMGNVCYYSLEKIVSSHLLSKKLKVCVPMSTHCTITCFGFHARWIDGVKRGLFSNHAPLGQTTLRGGMSICIVYGRKLRLG